jgi:AraC family transcriptional regulator of adaptative response/methylated-DNA-[protein]-cysteine methyltransferase
MAELHQLIHRWAGLGPESFLRAIAPDHAKALLADSAGVLGATGEVGLAGPGRLHDLFVTHEAMSRGAGVSMAFGFHQSPFGEAILLATESGLAGFGFVDDGDRDAALADMTRRWPRAAYREDPAVTRPLAARAFDPVRRRNGTPLGVVLIGTDFERRVWEMLLCIPCGRVTTYSEIARRLGNPKACRAVGAAVGHNPISFVIPCHRVLGHSGALTGYHWGVIRKQAMLGWEAGTAGA